MRVTVLPILTPSKGSRAVRVLLLACGLFLVGALVSLFAAPGTARPALGKTQQAAARYAPPAQESDFRSVLQSTFESGPGVWGVADQPNYTLSVSDGRYNVDIHTDDDAVW